MRVAKTPALAGTQFLFFVPLATHTHMNTIPHKFRMGPSISQSIRNASGFSLSLDSKSPLSLFVIKPRR